MGTIGGILMVLKNGVFIFFANMLTVLSLFTFRTKVDDITTIEKLTENRNSQQTEKVLF